VLELKKAYTLEDSTDSMVLKLVSTKVETP